MSSAGFVEYQVHHPDATVLRPIKELKGFVRLALEPGEGKRVSFALHTQHIGYYDEAMQYAVLPGTVEVMVGSSSEDIRLRGAFEICAARAMPVQERVFSCPVEVGLSSTTVG